MLIIPAIDIYDGKCVRLTQGDYNQKTIYSSSPAEFAKQIHDEGFEYLHVVDLQGAKEKKVINWNAITSILTIPKLKIEVGGGIRTAKDIKRLFELGVSRVVVGSVAVQNPELIADWISQFSAENIVIGMDIKDNKIAISGWIEKSDLDPTHFINTMVDKGAKYFICTDISKDGMLDGVNIDFYKNLLLTSTKISIIASGGITSMVDIIKLQKLRLSGIIVGKAIYEKTIDLKELAKYNGANC